MEKKAISPIPLQDSIDSPVDPSKLLRKKIENDHLKKLAHLHVHTLESLFSKINGVESDTIDKQKFYKVLNEEGFPLAKEPEVVESFYNALDVNGNGTVEKKELVIGLTILGSGSLEKKLELTFHIYDLNKDGKLSRDEIRTMLKTTLSINRKKALITKQEEEKWINNFIDDTFAQFDANGDGFLQFSEFKEAAKNRSDVADVFTLHGLVPEEN